MNKRLLKTILVLVSMLFLNIEAAHAGLVGRLKLYIQSELPTHYLWCVAVATAFMAMLVYVIFTPISINNQKWSWYNYFSFQPGRSSYGTKRLLIKKITKLLAQKSVIHSR